MATFVSPEGNYEIWEEMPEGYYTVGQWESANPPAEPEGPSQEEQEATIRAERDKRLVASDISQLVDVQAKMSQEEITAWSTYRQALRDLPQQDGFPWGGVVSAAPWPTAPGKI